MTAELGQSSAAHTISSLTSLGVHGAANESVPGTWPAKSRNPSPASRAGPQVKQVGNAWRAASRNGDDRLTSAARSRLTGGQAATSTVVADASATRWGPS